VDRLSEVKEAQERVEVLQKAGVDMRSPEARQAVNRLIAHLRKLTPEERDAFDAWKAERGDAGPGEAPARADL
jgi:hypothetical protein